MTTHTERSLAHIQAVTDARERLRDVYAEAHQRDERPAVAQIAVLHGQIGDGLKLAEVHALLAIGEAVQNLGLSL